MGMTRVFYFVKKNELTAKQIREKLRSASALAYPSYSVFYKDTLDWLPVFDTNYCEGRYNADEGFLTSLEETFGSPVIALSSFDSDAVFVSIYENGELHRYIHADEFMLEEFGFEEYEPAIPAELESYVNAEELRKLWNEEHFFDAEDFIQDLVRLLNTFLAFDEDDAEEDVEIICK